jgi:hypothetical protein
MGVVARCFRDYIRYDGLELLFFFIGYIHFLQNLVLIELDLLIEFTLKRLLNFVSNFAPELIRLLKDILLKLIHQHHPEVGKGKVCLAFWVSDSR